MMATLDGKYNSLPSSLDRKLRRVLLYARISVLAMLDYYGKDGVAYQDIKDALKLEDGSLGPNLMWLKENGYAESKEEKVEDKAIAVYYITGSGKQACYNVKQWLDGIFIHQEEKEKAQGIT
jgi:DNA-binding PadR family transcriptional regulator